MEAHHTNNPNNIFRGRKVKDQGHQADQLNAETESVSYLPVEIQTWCTEGVRGPVSPTSAMTSKVKEAQGRDAKWCM